MIAGSRVDLADSSIGMAVKSGAPKPNISTAEAFVSTLLAAKSIGYSGGLCGNYSVHGTVSTIRNLGATRGRRASVLWASPFGAAVARGEVVIGFRQVSELLAVDGVDYMGPLPDEYQKVSTFSGGLTTRSRNPKGARALLDLLSSREVAREIEAVGLEPRSRQREASSAGP